MDKYSKSNNFTKVQHMCEVEEAKFLIYVVSKRFVNFRRQRIIKIDNLIC